MRNDNFLPVAILVILVSMFSYLTGYSNSREDIVKTCKSYGVYVAKHIKMECKINGY